MKLFLPGRLHDGRGVPAQRRRDPERQGRVLQRGGVGIDKYKGAAQTFINDFKRPSGKAVDPYAILGAQAGQVLLNGIGTSDGSRADVLTNVYATKVTNGLIGDFQFNENGDLSGAKGAAVLFTIYKGTNKLNTLLTTAPEPELVAAARKEAAG